MDIFAGIVVCILMLRILFQPIFKDRIGFMNSIHFLLTPDLLSELRGEGGSDWWAEMKLFTWLGSSLLTGLAAFTAVNRLFS